MTPHPTNSTTHYQVLGVGPTATPEQIRRAYRRLAKTVHPDVNPASDSAKAFAALNAAYETLIDPVRRSAYDRELHDPVRARADTRAHYTWTNIAQHRSDRQAPTTGEVDELYDTFFRGSPPGST